MEDKFKEVAGNLYITTDDGSYGRSGMVTKVIDDLITNEGKTYDWCVSCLLYTSLPAMAAPRAVRGMAALPVRRLLPPAAVYGSPQYAAAYARCKAQAPYHPLSHPSACLQSAAPDQYRSCLLYTSRCV